jgi:hypothetical protein
MPVAAVEIQVSLQAYEWRMRDSKNHLCLLPLATGFHYYGLAIAACKELGIAVIAYSYAALISLFFSTHTHNRPLGRGQLAPLPKAHQAGDPRQPFARSKEVCAGAHPFSSLFSDTTVLQSTSAVIS